MSRPTLRGFDRWWPGLVDPVADMTDNVAMIHRHDDDERPMRHIEDERIDGLRLRQYSCDCGFAAAVLTKVEEEHQGASWPFSFRMAPPVS
jgi:hypothetical protein